MGIKRHWRRSGLAWCCFVRTPGPQGAGFHSLCGARTRDRSGGQTLGRPPAHLRCAQCDILEMKICRSAESLPTSKNWRELLYA